MGQAKNRKKEIEDFISSLSSEERIIFDLSKKAYDRIIRAHDFQGACYHMTFLLKAILHREFNIEIDAVIGFVNDGTDDLMISHGWLEYRGRKIDVALANPNNGQLPGPVLILDQKFQEHGSANYTYHRERGEAGEQAILRLLNSEHPQAQMLAQQKEREHSFMTEVANSEEKIMEYLNNAPNGATYERLFELLSSGEKA
ncbi:MAG: hypothetical protein K2Q26_02755 [Bdellovibrionales bacterium]|nr:hypothetical protein [Bdellovibrionales bacterium]